MSDGAEDVKGRQRCIEPEVVFGQMKQDFSKDKVRMDFAFFAIAFNTDFRKSTANFVGLKAERHKEL